MELYSAAELAAEHIRELIYSGALRPDTKVTLDALARRLGVSRTPIRDAVASLEREGMVRIVPRVGVYPREISLSEVTEVYALKAELEPLMAQWAAERASLAEREEFYASIEPLQALVRAQDAAGYVDLVERRRQRLLQMSRSEVLADVFRAMDSRVRPMRHSNLTQPARMKVSAQEHVAIAKAVLAGDAALAYKCTQRHVNSAMRSLIQLMSSQATQDGTTDPPVAASASAVRSRGQG